MPSHFIGHSKLLLCFYSFRASQVFPEKVGVISQRGDNNPTSHIPRVAILQGYLWHPGQTFNCFQDHSARRRLWYFVFCISEDPNFLLCTEQMPFLSAMFCFWQSSKTKPQTNWREVMNPSSKMKNLPSDKCRQRFSMGLADQDDEALFLPDVFFSYWMERKMKLGYSVKQKRFRMVSTAAARCVNCPHCSVSSLWVIPSYFTQFSQNTSGKVLSILKAISSRYYMFCIFNKRVP